MGSTCEFHPLDPYRGYVMYRTRNDEGTEQYWAFRPGDYLPLVKTKDLDTLKKALDTIDNADENAEEEI